MSHVMPHHDRLMESASVAFDNGFKSTMFKSAAAIILALTSSVSASYSYGGVDARRTQQRLRQERMVHPKTVHTSFLNPTHFLNRSPKNVVGQVHAFTLLATGTQNYNCNKTGETTFAWTLKNPDAELYVVPPKKSNRVVFVGTHDFMSPFVPNPYWTLQDEDCTAIIDTTVLDRSPSPVAGAIPWLATGRTSNLAQPSDCETPTIKLYRAATRVLRLNTVGGVAPSADSCNAGAVNKLASVNYLTTYWVYVDAKDSKLIHTAAFVVFPRLVWTPSSFLPTPFFLPLCPVLLLPLPVLPLLLLRGTPRSLLLLPVCFGGPRPLDAMSHTALKQTLSALGLSSSGNKLTLLPRLLSALQSLPRPSLSPEGAWDFPSESLKIPSSSSSTTSSLSSALSSTSLAPVEDGELPPSVRLSSMNFPLALNRPLALPSFSSAPSPIPSQISSHPPMPPPSSSSSHLPTSSTSSSSQALPRPVNPDPQVSSRTACHPSSPVVPPSAPPSSSTESLLRSILAAFQGSLEPPVATAPPIPPPAAPLASPSPSSTLPSPGGPLLDIGQHLYDEPLSCAILQSLPPTAPAGMFAHVLRDLLAEHGAALLNPIGIPPGSSFSSPKALSSKLLALHSHMQSMSTSHVHYFASVLRVGQIDPSVMSARQLADELALSRSKDLRSLDDHVYEDCPLPCGRRYCGLRSCPRFSAAHSYNSGGPGVPRRAGLTATIDLTDGNPTKALPAFAPATAMIDLMIETEIRAL
ncbi:hypothetical protein BC829DRAFT_448781 [Chytridium lagenaria]|nr:hypothetical protein BC829DRAFT_448781 [Chytridium lagenaria]